MHSLEIGEATEREWTALHGRSSQGSVFTSWDFRDRVDRAATLVIGKLSGECVLGAWLSEKPFPFSKYVGILSNFQNMSVRECVRYTADFLSQLGQFRPEFTLQVLDDEITSLAIAREVATGRFRSELQLEIVGTISSADIVAGNHLSRDRASELRRNAGVAISTDLRANEMHELLRVTFDRQNLDLLPGLDDTLERYFLFSATKGRVNCIRDGSEAVAATLFLAGKGRAHYVMGATSDLARSRGYMANLIQDQLSHYSSSGTPRIDMMNVADPGRGDYKLSFGCNLHHLARIKIGPSL